ncbi:hypothetical protein BDV95DRAFT_267478 [Massariosphaeria phaeospora]|uniref:Chitin-binding type-4 domain-containing protein n=1 Tax=Massariosphaeria phaeospora TaxID=100035 RepID=A0A7C8HYH2_9PLEO|nr:hypothetical protein BDV95DRAFT_267478 [Massariosphaeria phaeospora]
MYTSIISLFALAGIAHSHMRVCDPPVLMGDNNPNTPQGKADPFLNYPYGCCGKEEPGICRGHLDKLDGPEGAPVATWAAGQKVNFTLTGRSVESATYNEEGGTHWGGSCQAGFSVDKGKTFRVATTWQGNCPHREGSHLDPSSQTFDMTVPADLPAGERIIFAHTWINREKEFFMSCSVVTISGGSGEAPETPPDAPASSAAPYQPSGTPAPEEPEAPASSVKPPKSTRAPKPTPNPYGTQPAYPQPTSSVEEKSEFSLEGCTCACPAQTWSEACSCYGCDSPATKRHLVERRALELHRRNLELAAAPVRRAESVAWAKRPLMLLTIDNDDAKLAALGTPKCTSAGDPAEVEFPNPGPEVVDTDGQAPLQKPNCSG